MAKSPLSRRPRIVINQDGAPTPQTNEGTVTVGRQDDKPSAKPAAKA